MRTSHARILPRGGKGTAQRAVEGASSGRVPSEAPTTVLRTVPFPLRGRIPCA